MYQYIYNSRCYQRCISIFITYRRRYQRCISIFIIVGVPEMYQYTRDVSVYL